MVPNRYLTPKFPYIFGLSSKQTLNIPSNQGVGAPPASGGESEGGSSTPQTPSLVITNQPTNATIADPSISNYWQEAYNEAKKAYGQYTLVSDFGSLFSTDGENSTESIFELQISEAAANSQMGRNYTPFKYKMGMHF